MDGTKFIGNLTPAVGRHCQKDRWTHNLTVQELRDALADPRLDPDQYVGLTVNYPALAISTGDEANWYLGYIDLFDGSIVLNAEPGADDGKNPFKTVHNENVACFDDRWAGPR